MTDRQSKLYTGCSSVLEFFIQNYFLNSSRKKYDYHIVFLTDKHTDGRMDISNYCVASENIINNINFTSFKFRKTHT